MNLDILTPSFEQPDFLCQCITSVREQLIDSKSHSLTHFVQNGGIDTKTQAVLCCMGKSAHEINGYKLVSNSEPDEGMYDALNRAFASTSGEIIGHLNCDEQYLPGTLSKVSAFFEEHPDVMVLLGGAVICSPDGQYICSRMPVVPKYWHSRLCHLGVLTCSMFYRRELIERLGMYFDPSFKSMGDADLVCRMIQSGAKMHVLHEYFSIFIETGCNLALSDSASQEQRNVRSAAPLAMNLLRPYWILGHRIRKWKAGCYKLRPFSYTLLDQNNQWVDVEVASPVSIWKR